jgi:uncharacterized integral membrane protein
MEGESKGRSLVTSRNIAAAVIVVVALVFVLENRAETKISFVLTSVDAPLWVALGATFLLGMLAGWLVSRRR